MSTEPAGGESPAPAESRALPVLDRPIDNTALAAYMECPWKYYASMVLHRRLHRDITSPALAYGTTWHAILEEHYRTNGDESAVLEAAVKSWVNHGREDDHRTLQRALLSYEQYVEKFGKPSDEDAKTVGWPENPLIELQLNVQWNGCPWPYAGKIDRIIELNGLLYVEDHKTTSQMGPYFFKNFELSNQMMGYVWMAQMFTKKKVAGVRINAHAILKRESKFERQIISYSQSRLEDWAENYALWAKQLQAAHEAQFFPRNYNACSGKYGMCQYANVCSMPPKHRMAVLEQDYEEFAWNPLTHEEEI